MFSIKDIRWCRDHIASSISDKILITSSSVSLLKIKILIGLLFTIISTNTEAQEGTTRGLKTVPVSLSGAFVEAGTNGLPFDEPFYLKGAAGEADRIDLRYRVSPIQNKKQRSKFRIPGVTMSGYKLVIEGKDHKVSKKGKFRLKKKVREAAIGSAHCLVLQIPEKGRDPFTGKVIETPESIAIAFDGFQFTKKNVKDSIPVTLRKTYYFPSKWETRPDGYQKKAVTWRKGDTSDFVLRTGPLHPGVKYDFEFNVYRKLNLGKKDSAAFINAVKREIAREFPVNVQKKRSGNDDVEFERRLQKLLSSYAGEGNSVVTIDDKPFKMDALSEGVWALLNEMNSNNTNLLNGSSATLDLISGLLEKQSAILSSFYYNNDVVGILKNVILFTAPPDTNKFQLDESFSSKWKQPIPELQPVSYEFIAGILTNTVSVKEILAGRKKIDTGGVAPSLQSINGRDTGSIHLPDLFSAECLYAFFRALFEENVSVKDKNKTHRLQQMEGYKQSYHTLYYLIQALEDRDHEAAKVLAGRFLKEYDGPLVPPASPINNMAVSLTRIAENDHAHLSGPTKTLLTTLLNPANTDFGKMQVLDAVRLVSRAWNSPGYFRELFTGGMKIDETGKFFTPANGRTHLNSIRVFLDIFRLINSPYFADSTAKRLFNAPDQRIKLDYIIQKFEKYFTEIDQLKAAEKQQESGAQVFHNELSRTLLQTTYKFEGSSIINISDVPASKNPHFGVDLGIGYATTGLLVIHESLHYYFKPLNRDVPIASFHGFDKLWKMASVFVGFTQNLSANANDTRYKPLFDSGTIKTSVLAGVGLRLGSLVRLNTGVLIYRKPGPNPLDSSTRISSGFTMSIGVDLSIAKLLSYFK